MDDELKMMLENVREEYAWLRGSIGELHMGVHRSLMASQHVETRIIEVLDRMRQGDADHKDLAARIADIERRAMHVQAWSAGAAAVVVAIFGGIGWIASHMPVLMKVVE